MNPTDKDRLELILSGLLWNIVDHSGTIVHLSPKDIDIAIASSGWQPTTPPENQEFNCLPACPTCRRIHPKGECEADKPQEVCAEGNRLCVLDDEGETCGNYHNGHYCTRKPKHKGDHIACCTAEETHNCHLWPQQL